MPASLSFAPFGLRPSRGRLGSATACAAALILTSAACFDTPAGSAPVDERGPLASDSTLARDLTLAGRTGQSSAMNDTVQVAATGTVAAAPARSATPAAPIPSAQATRATSAAAREAGTRPRAGTRSQDPSGVAPRTPAGGGPIRLATTPPAAAAPQAPARSEQVAALPQPSPAAGEPVGRSPEVAPRVVPARPAVPETSIGRGTIAAGSTLALTTAARVCTATNAPGDRIVATLDDAARGSGGFTLAAGTKAVLEVASVERDAANRPAAIHFQLRNLDDGSKAYPARGAVATLDTLRRARSTKHPPAVGRHVAGGALLGAVAGQVLGRNTRSTIIGAAAGTAMGGALSVARSSVRSEACLPAGTKMQVRLAEPVVAE